MELPGLGEPNTWLDIEPRAMSGSMNGIRLCFALQIAMSFPAIIERSVMSYCDMGR